MMKRVWMVLLAMVLGVGDVSALVVGPPIRTPDGLVWIETLVPLDFHAPGWYPWAPSARPESATLKMLRRVAPVIGTAWSAEAPGAMPLAEERHLVDLAATLGAVMDRVQRRQENGDVWWLHYGKGWGEKMYLYKPAQPEGVTGVWLWSKEEYDCDMLPEKGVPAKWEQRWVPRIKYSQHVKRYVQRAEGGPWVEQGSRVDNGWKPCPKWWGGGQMENLVPPGPEPYTWVRQTSESWDFGWTYYRLHLMSGELPGVAKQYRFTWVVDSYHMDQLGGYTGPFWSGFRELVVQLVYGDYDKRYAKELAGPWGPTHVRNCWVTLVGGVMPPPLIDAQILDNSVWSR